ncbi:MAG: TonB-dependent receptor [Holophagales bacterium]|nr:TonB-dependent receptor [Holophagales bacterium]
MRRNILVTSLVAVLAVGASGIYASAQDTTSAVLTGTVTGPDGKPLPNVRVYLTSGALLTPRDGRTDANGRFNFRLLPPGRYTITYSMDGFISRKAEMSLIAGVMANGDIRLRAMDVQGAAVEIVAEVSNVITPDKTDTAVQTAVTSDRIEEIGGRRGVGALQDLTPGLYGAIIGNTTNQQTTFSIRGGMGRGNKVLQDGQMVNDALAGIYFNSGDTIEDLVESVAVIQSPLNAKLGNTDGGIISITTKRGGNMFSGSLRYGGQRGNGLDNQENAWRTTTVYYPDSRGYARNPASPGGDLFNKNWQWSLTGPIIPNYLTFAVGGNLTPSVNTQQYWRDIAASWAQGQWPASLWGPNAGMNVLNRYVYLGTFYYDNDPTSSGYGDIVRKSYWGEANGPDSYTYYRSSSNTNTFNLYLQATPNHQFTYYYNQSNLFQGVLANRGVSSANQLLENPTDNGLDMISIAWNVSYKAVLGASGVFDARFGKSSSFYDYRTRGNESVTVRTYRSYISLGSLEYMQNIDPYYGSWEQIANTTPGKLGELIRPPGGNPYYADSSGWVSSGMIDNAWQGLESTGGWRGAQAFTSIGADASGTYGSDAISANANYQHMLEFKGQHVIDVGWNMNQVDAPGMPNGARYRASPVGQISYDIDIYHIGNRFADSYEGGHGSLGIEGPNAYRGKYIVFDVNRAMISDLEPWVLNRPGYVTQVGGVPQQSWLQDGLLWTRAGGGIHSQLRPYLTREYLPHMREFWGSDVGNMRTTTSSIYVNDMWTIDEHHSVMVGLRADMFSLKDSARTVHSYTKITPRLEYKFDLNGDQRHLFAASLAQFHQMPAANLFWPFIEKKWGNMSSRYWTGDDLSDPTLRKSGYYLVGKEDILNPKNYSYDMEFDYSLSGTLFGDVEKDFRPPTSTEFSVWYRHTFASGGSFKVSFNNRTWSDLYDMFPSSVFAWDNPNTVDVDETARIKATLRNTKDYTRKYNGVELQWDFPITRKVSFGGNYTYSRYFHNQTGIGSSEEQVDAAITSTGIGLQTPWHFDSLFSSNVVDADGNVLYNFGGHNAWSPMQSQSSEFGLGYYLIVNLTQGKARSNFTLRGNYTGGSTNYDRVTINTGQYLMPPGKNAAGADIFYNTFPGQSQPQLQSNMSAYFGKYTTNDSFSTNLTYNLNMPIAKRLTWFLNINVSNAFNHQPYVSSVPGGNMGNQSIVPWPFQANARGDRQNLAWDRPYLPPGAPDNPNYYNPAPNNPFVRGWSMSTTELNSGPAGRYYFGRYNSDPRTISMSTGIRF